MKILAAAVLLIFSGHLFAQGRNTPPGTPGEMKNNLLQIEHEIGRANLDCDYKYFDQVEGEDFIFTDAAGTVSNKKQDMAGEKDCRKTEGKYDVDSTEVRLFGNTAVVTGRITIAHKNKEEKLVTRRSRFTDVFVWRDGHWQLVAGHSSRIPDPVAQK